MNYYISDLHLEHANVIRFDKRPFFNTKEMGEEIIKRWNARVKPGDSVYILGDFCMSKNEDDWFYYLNKLNGKKFLIKGNHDIRMSGKLKSKFSQICDYKEISDCGKRIVMCHYPIITYRADYKENTYMFYGHVHVSVEADLINEAIKNIHNKPNEFWGEGIRPLAQLCNVGCMISYMDYTPRTADEIIGANGFLKN